MALTTAVHDSLPYIDPEPTPSERAAAQALIDAEVPSESTTHPSLPALTPTHFSPLIELELERVSALQPLTAIDLSRYESSTLPAAPPPPPSTPKSKSKTKTKTKAQTQTPNPLEPHHAALARAQTASSYLRLREDSMTLLSRFGKNAWLVSNSQTEDVLRDLEVELEGRKTEIDGVVIQRRAAQEEVRGEVEGLAEGWRRGVGRVLDTEVAAEGMRRGVLERRRAGAV